MTGVLIGFAIVAVVILAGYFVGRSKILGEKGNEGLSKLAFFVLNPALLLTVIADADLGRLFSAVLPIQAIGATIVMAIVVVVLLIWRRGGAETTITALAAGLVNGANIGLPVAAYVLGDAAASVPVILLQQIVITPIALAILDIQTSGRSSWRRTLIRPFLNPTIIAAVLGLAIAISGVEIPAPIMEPFLLIGGAAIPIVLIAFGASLSGTRVLQPGSGRKDVALASALKLVLMPAVVWGLSILWGLEGHELFVMVVLAALPTAQNVFTYAQRYGRAVIVARDTVLITTVLAIPVNVVLAAVLAA